VRSLELARKSSAKGSSYGQLTLGFLLLSVVDGLELEDDQALELFRLAAGQGLDMAQFQLGEMYYYGFGIAEDITEAQRWYQLAATQGYPEALHRIALWGR
jgi:TPR repeat protein